MEKKAQRHLKLRQVELFLEAAKHGKAETARTRGISASALVQALADLEADLGGVALFDRTQRGALTPAGAAFREQARRLLDNEAAARHAVLRSVENQKSAPLRLAYTPEFAGTVTRLLRRLFEVRGRVETIETDIETLERLVMTVSVDLALAPDKLAQPLPKQMSQLEGVVPEVRVLSKDERIVIDGVFVALEDLQNEAFAFPWFENETPPAQRSARRVVERYFARTGFTPARIAYCGDSLASVLDAVATGEVVSIYPISEASRVAGLFVSMPVPSPRAKQAYIYSRDGEPFAAVASLFSRHFDLQHEEQSGLFAATIPDEAELDVRSRE